MTTDIKLELVRFAAPDPVMYLQRINVAVAPKNGGTVKILVHDITLEFASDLPGVPASRLQFTKPCDACLLGIGAHEIFSVPVVPSLVFMQNTNCYRVRARWSLEEDPVNIQVYELPPPQRFILVHPLPIAEDLQCFVSFKDPEDLALAELAKRLLTRAGMKVYLARNDPRPGSKMWDDKIGSSRIQMGPLMAA